MNRIKRLNELFNSDKETDLKNDVSNMIYFLKQNGIYSMSDYYKISDRQKWMFNSLLKHSDKEYQKELMFLIELELSSIEERKQMLKKYEDLEDYDRCSKIKNKLY